MSLKNLVKRANDKVGGKSNLRILPEMSSPPFRGLDYFLTTRQPSISQLKTILGAILETLEETESQGKELGDKDKKAMILTFYRLAFAQESRARGAFHPSEISTEATLCHRKMYYQKASVKQDATYVPFTADNRMQRLCDLGSMKHLYVQENLDRIGVLVDMETPVEDDAIGIRGKADGIVKFSGEDDLGNFYDEDMVLEVKTINEYGFKALRGPKQEHVKQASLYGGVLGYKNICFLYYNKNTSEHKIYVAPIDYPYFDNFCITAKGLVNLYNKNVRRARSTDVLTHEDVPERVCKTITAKRATECAYRDFCFNVNS